MARMTTDDSTSGQTDHNPIRIQAEPGAHIDLPSNAYVSDSQILRDGQDLLLRTADGPEILIENYFLAEPSPLLVSLQGAALTPEMVDSFARPADGVQFAQKGSVDDSSPVGMIREVSGEATVTHANGITEKASVGTAIYQGDIVQTRGDGAINITFVDDTTFAVSENARLAIDEYVFDPATQSGESNFSVMQGVFVFTSGLIGREDPDDVKINTPVGSIGIRGTTIMGDINPDGESQVTVVEGAIVITNGTGEQTLSQQYETIKLNGYDSEIVNAGTLSTEQINETYTVLRTVSAELFSQIDDSGDSAAEESSSDGLSGEAAPDTDVVPVEDIPDSEPVDAEMLEETESNALPVMEEPLMLNTDEGFDLDAETVKILTSGDAGTTSDTYSGTTSDTSLSSTTLTTTEAQQTTTTTTSTSTSTTTVTAPPPPPPYDLLVNGYIGGANSNFIPGFGGSNFHQGTDVLSLGDYNHDGNADFAFTTAMELVLHMPINGLDLMTDYGLSTNNYSIASLGDINGDGFGDLVLGTPGENGDQGRITIIDLNNPAATFWQINGAAGTTEFGYSVSGIGDFNGDGFNDILAGAPGSGGGPSYSYVIYGHSNFYASSVNLSQLGTNPLDPEGFMLSAGINVNLGENIVGLKDFNGDGFSDFAVSRPGTGGLSILYGTNLSTMNVSAISGINSITEISVFSAGDMNGGGKSDLAFYEQGTDTLHVLFGEAPLQAAQTLAGITNKLSIVSSAGEIISGGHAGDFNGDGFNDIAVASRNGAIVDIYVVYGKPGLSGTIDLATLGPAANFHARIDLGGAAFDYDTPTTAFFQISIESMGDRNKDGFDDLMIGLPNIDLDNTLTHSDDGGVVIIDGRRDADGIPPNIIYANTSTHNATATAANQTLVGDAFNNFFTNDNGTNTGTRYLGGGGNDHFRVFGAPPAELNGGSGMDKVEFMTSGMIDLSVMGSNLGGIERIILAGTTSTLRLGIDDIFRLLQESDSRSLTIEGSSSTQLVIEDNTASNPTNESLTHFGFTYAGDTNAGTTGGYNAYNFGGYTVLVSDMISSTQVA